MKRFQSFIAALLVLCMSVSLCVFAFADNTSVMLGDVNGDGKVNTRDVLALRKNLAGLGEEVDALAADCNADGKVNTRDVLTLRKYLAGLGDLGEQPSDPPTTTAEPTTVEPTTTEPTTVEPTTTEPTTTVSLQPTKDSDGSMWTPPY